MIKKPNQKMKWLLESLIVLEVVCNKEFVEELKFEKVGLIDMVNVWRWKIVARVQ